MIALTDPGVPNWLDPVGHSTGTICGRVLYPGEPPITTLRVVSLTNLRQALPASTPWIDGATRSEALRRRAFGVRRRFRE